MKIFFNLFILLLFFINAHSQNNKENTLIVKDSVFASKNALVSLDIDPLTPSKAAFYSAILPGLGQAYNKSYWKIPLVYAGIGISTFFYVQNTQKHHDYRDAYKRRLQGFNDDNFSYLDNERLIYAQKIYKRNQSLSLLFIAGFYILNIIDANVDAALHQFNVNERLSLKTNLYQNEINYKTNIAITLNYNF